MKSKLSLILIWSILSMGQTVLGQGRTVTGKVTDESDGSNLPGVIVRVKGKSTVSQTDASGSYSIVVGGSEEVLVFSLVGVNTKEETVGNRSIINVSLSSNNELLSEVVVVGYGTQKKVNLTGAVDQVGGEVFEGRVMPNVSQMLMGAVPNLNINLADGKPTRSPSFNIRGTTSIGQGGSALIIIDGVEGDPSTLNPNDIESVSVLKDASSAAVYGSRGTYGVVLITTKNAKKGQTSVSYSGNFSIQEQASSPQFVKDGYVFAERFYEAYNAWNNYSSIPARLNKTQNFSLAWLEEFKRRKEAGINEPVTTDANGNYIYYGNEDYYSALIRNSTYARDQNLSFSGNTEKSDFYLSGRYYGYDGIYRYNSDTYNNYSLRAKGGVNVTSWLRITNNMDFSSIQYHNPMTAGEGGNIFRNIADEGHTSAPIFNPDGTLSFPAAYTIGDFIYGKNGADALTNNLRNTTAFEANFFNNTFRIKGDFTFRNRDHEVTTILLPVPYSTREGVITYLKTSRNDLITNAKQNTKYLFGNLYGEYENTFATKHYFKGLIGYNYEQQTYNSTNISKNGLLTENTENINLALGSAVTATAGYNKYRLAGVFARANYIFADKYLLELNGRYDGSSKFPGNSQWGFFPSISAGWRISGEDFWKIKTINDLKIRYSFGSLGNGNISPYAFMDLYGISTSGRVLDGIRNPSTSVPGVIPDNLTWETAQTSNFGLDLAAFNNRVTLTADVYVRKTLDMYTVGQTLPDVFGASSPKGNYADLTTRGFEVSLGYNNHANIGSKRLNYNLKATLADYITTIDRYNNQTGALSDYYKGMRIGEIWGYVTQGLFQSQEEIDNAPSQILIKSSNSGKYYPGDIRFTDLNGDGVIDYGDNTIYNSGDRKIIGNRDPRYIYSFQGGADWNNFFLSFFFQGVGKQDWYPSNESIFWGQYNRPYNKLPEWHLNNYWTEDRRDAYLPRYAGYNTHLKQTPQTRYLQNAAYFRLKNLQVGYNLPHQITSKIKAKNIRLALSGENLFTWSPLYKRTKDIDIANIGASDPDINSGHGDGFNYPTLRTYSLNILVNF
ncbi:TonB-dependent receptor [Leadbetterella byssophila DSM 17132]|uniref:TonB-dependent receptor n=1 Tax=Leadbetterella byssophila (strain DSM 17132 / JCM 16389 / KACC 11308 / NBRC 106382 / 4M15) TaxID=649349 RepID=E4RVP2_LEAB4|nr:TonB-dependent receptor [Leadbetterella byssophila]ADQ17941.1 TonB-dependent receptor [Leadbetterella byssophila DSM 17132]